MASQVDYSYNNNFFYMCGGTRSDLEADTWMNETKRINFPLSDTSGQIYRYQGSYKGKNLRLARKFGVRFETESDVNKAKKYVRKLNELCR